MDEDKEGVLTVDQFRALRLTLNVIGLREGVIGELNEGVDGDARETLDAGAARGDANRSRALEGVLKFDFGTPIDNAALDDCAAIISLIAVGRSCR